MIKINRLIAGFFILAIFAMSKFVFAKEKSTTSFPFPKAFMYQNKPLDALCLSRLANGDSSRFDPLSIAECSKHSEYKIESLNNELINKGFIGFDYSVQTNSTIPTNGYIYYKLIGLMNNLYVIYLIENGGGSGHFSSIFLVERMGDILQLKKEIAGGDRCNGGINTDPKLVDNKLTYQMDITPYDMIVLSGETIKDLVAYDDLAACAVCCEATALYEHDFNTAQLISITLEKDAGNNNASIQGRYQSCFDKLIHSHLKKNKRVLSVQELKDFGRKFNQECILK